MFDLEVHQGSRVQNLPRYGTVEDLKIVFASFDIYVEISFYHFLELILIADTITKIAETWKSTKNI